MSLQALDGDAQGYQDGGRARFLQRAKHGARSRDDHAQQLRAACLLRQSLRLPLHVPQCREHARTDVLVDRQTVALRRQRCARRVHDRLGSRSHRPCRAQPGQTPTPCRCASERAQAHFLHQLVDDVLHAGIEELPGEDLSVRLAGPSGGELTPMARRLCSDLWCRADQGVVAHSEAEVKDLRLEASDGPNQLAPAKAMAEAESHRQQKGPSCRKHGQGKGHPLAEKCNDIS
mmetsp:Transcript_26373/g.87419  ORF Transcript_26373/g.87419 Transcript_26373/m.87419 type:complete len:232 (-) Transcript_26373:2443-3138(-)